MHPLYHRLVTCEALDGCFAPRALQAVVAANLRQDGPFGQLGHPEFHFDHNAFAPGWDFVARSHAAIRPALAAGKPAAAWSAFGRLTHAVQDLYAHSDYVRLWLARFPEGATPPPEAIDPDDAALLGDGRLRSGKVYFPYEYLSFVPFLKEFSRARLPHDAHAWMNLDGPERGPLFAYVRAAAVKRTALEYRRAVDGLPSELRPAFHG